MPPRDAVQMPTVLVALAVIEGRPIQSSTGNDTSVPPPATELIAPATNAAQNAMRWAAVRCDRRSILTYRSPKTAVVVAGSIRTDASAIPTATQIVSTADSG